MRRVRFGGFHPLLAIIKSGGKWITEVLVTGVKDQLGHDVTNELALRGIEGIGVNVEEMGITDRIARETVVSQEKSDAITYCAAYTAAGAAEDNLELYRKINTEGTRNVAGVCKAMDIKAIHISTNCVPNGSGQWPWKPDDHREPLNVYELTKYEDEIAVEQNTRKYFIARIAQVFGVNGKNFIKTTLRLGEEKGVVSIVNDQVGSPIYTYDLVRLLADMTQIDRYGRYHTTNEGLCSWYEFACEILRQASMGEVKVTPVDSDGFPVEAKRLSNSRMSKEKPTKNGFERLPSWQDALGCYLKVLKENGMA